MGPRLPAGDAQARPLAFQQERLWFLHRLDPRGVAYNMPFLIRLDGPVDVGALQVCLDEVVRRHEVLRARFPEVDGQAVQVVEPARPVLLRQEDVSALPPECREEQAARLAREEVGRPFDLARGGLLRVLLIRLDQDLHHLVFAFHHIVGDAAAAQVLLRELVALYGPLARGEAATLPELQVQYADYVAWQRDQLRQTTLMRQLAYWEGRLAGMPHWIDLPADRRPPPLPSSRGGSRSLRLSAEATAALRAVARQARTTLFVVLLAALQALLHRYSGQTDIVVGIPVSDRRRVQFEPLIGFFVNTVLLRGQVTGDLLFQELLRATRDEVLDALDHQDLPFERVVEAVGPARTARNPLFQVMLAFDESDEPAEIDVDGLRFTPLAFERDGATVDLSVCVSAGRDGLHGHVEFAADLFDPDTVDRLIGHLKSLLGGVVADPGARVADLPVLTAEEHRQLQRWNQTGRAFPDTRGMHRLFEAQARRSPRRVAVVAGRREVSYQALDRAANHLAHRLVALGVGPGSFVGISATRSPEMVAGLLAVLKAGGAYVGLDPEFGEARIRFALEDLSVRAVLADDRLRGVLPNGTEVVALPAACEDAAAEDPPEAEVSGEHLAYAIYTSGSTGVPKAVGIRHSAAANFLHWAATRFPAEELAGVLATTSPVLDCTLFEIFTPLSWGGTAVLARSTLDLPALPARDRVRLVSTVPTTMEELLRQGDLPPGVVAVNLVGDVVPARLVAAPDRGTGIRRIYNHYGPSEATTYTTGACVVDRTGAGSVSEQAQDLAPTIGWPVANVQLHVADEHLNLVPLGVPGELFIGGAALASGYVGRPTLTAERFLPDPWSGRPGAKVYRTGDLVRYRRDGSLDFLGRKDRQVKIRGFRIESGEVEAALDTHPQVGRSVAVVRDEPDGDRRLVAYFVPTAGRKPPTTRELLAHVRARLPPYMVPAVIVGLESLPLTANGKVDRKALPPPNPPGRQAPAPSTSPETVLEAVLAELWAHLLGRDRVEVTDDFFDLGGNSLRMVALGSRLEETFGATVPLADLLGAATVRDLAPLVADAAAERLTLPRVGPFQDPPLFLVYPGGASFFRLATRPAGWLGRAVVGLLPVALLGGDPPHLVEDMSARYLEAVVSMQPCGPYLLAGVEPGGAIACELARRLAERGERVALLALVPTPWPEERPDSQAEQAAALARRFAGDGASLRDDEAQQLARLWRRYCSAVDGYQAEPYLGTAVWVGRDRSEAAAWSRRLPQLRVVCGGASMHPSSRSWDELATLAREAVTSDDRAASLTREATKGPLP